MTEDLPKSAPLKSRGALIVPPDMADDQTIIPSQRLPSGSYSGTHLELLVAHAYTPSDFYVTLRSQIPRLNQLMHDLNEFYADRSRYQLDLRHVKKGVLGLLVAAQYLEEGIKYPVGWHRAIVTEVEDLKHLKVKYLDYGTVSIVHISHIRFLSQRFLDLPIQALSARLLGLRANPKGKHWSTEAISHFRRLCIQVNLNNTGGFVATKILKGSKERLCLILVDMVTNYRLHGININEQMLKLKLASRIEPKSLASSEASMSGSSRPKVEVHKPSFNVVEDPHCDLSQRTMDNLLAKCADLVWPWLENSSNIFLPPILDEPEKIFDPEKAKSVNEDDSIFDRTF
eukprot:maker-scaffold9_size846264-snap-gene-4.23 protein:Tk08396 transcript:maker-scaffold9_size846264-snap-gene-4.23-mRNA-1 annotation:"tudor domain-containing protein 5"